jgi:hypothetical protein
MFETLLKIDESEFPADVRAVIAASDRSAANSPYSIAVAPEASRQNSLIHSNI